MGGPLDSQGLQLPSVGGMGSQGMGESLGMPQQKAQPQTLQDVVNMIKSLSMNGAGNPLTMRKSIELPQVMAPQQPNMAPYDASGTKRASVHNMFANIQNMIEKVNYAHEQKTARDVQFDLSRIKSAMDNPTPENQELVNEILNDSKRRKRLEKALDIKFFGEDKNSNTPERQGLKNYYDSLMKQFPSTLQIDPRAAMGAQMIQAGMMPKADTMMNFVKGLNADEARMFQAAVQAASKQDTVNAMKYLGELRASIAQRHDQSQERIGAGHDAARRYASDRSLEAAKERGAGKQTPFEKFALDSANKELKSNTDAIKADKDNITKLEDQKRKIKEPGFVARTFGDKSAEEAKKSLDEQIKSLKDNIDKLERRNKDVRSLVDTYQRGLSADDIPAKEEDYGQDSSDPQQFLDGLEKILNKEFSDNAGTDDTQDDEEPN